MKKFLFVLAVMISFVACNAAFAQDRPTVKIDWSKSVQAPVDDAIQLPWRKGVEKEGRKIESEQRNIEQGLQSGIQAIVNGQNAILAELKDMRANKLDEPVAPAPIMAPVAPPTFKERVESKKEEIKDAVLESPVLKHLAAFVGLILVLLVGHAIYVKCHADSAKITADLAKIPVVGAGLAAGFTSLDAFNTAVDTKVQAAISNVQSQVAGLQQSAVTTALATPAPSQVAAVVPAPVSAAPAAVAVAPAAATVVAAH